MKNKKSLGQHWLKNRAILDQIAALARADNSAALCLEIGPGLGTLTSSLLRQFERVIAIEYDPELARKLPGQFPGKNLQVVTADILEVNLAELIESQPQAQPQPQPQSELQSQISAQPQSLPQPQPYVVAGNIPYYITSPIIQKLLSVAPLPQRIVLLIQKEVAERIAAEPGKHSLLSLMVQNRASVELGPVVKAAEFTPPPKVDSQIIVLEPLAATQIPEAVLALAQCGFQNPRKKLATNLANFSGQLPAASLARPSAGPRLSSDDSPRLPRHTKAEWQRILAALTINPDARASDLDLWDWEELWQAARRADPNSKAT